MNDRNMKIIDYKRLFEIMYITKEEETLTPEKKAGYEKTLEKLLEIFSHPEKYYNPDELIVIKSARYF